MRLSVISNVLATWVGVMAAIVGGWIALDNYLEDSRKRVDQRAKETFELVKGYGAKDMVPVRDKVFRYVIGRRSCANDSALSIGLSDTEVFAFVEYFDLIVACVDAGLCDRGLAERFFAPYANVHWPVLQSEVLAIRRTEEAMKLDKPFGFGLESLAKTPIAAPGC